MSIGKTRTEQRRVWFGLHATVTIGHGFIHSAGFGKFSIPHPPVINWLLRKGLTEYAGCTLSFLHEFGHLQTLPGAVFYTGAMLALASLSGHTELIEIVLVLISTHAAWEMISELYTIASDTYFYHKHYKNITLLPRFIFWFLTGAVTIAGWCMIIL